MRLGTYGFFVQMPPPWDLDKLTFYLALFRGHLQALCLHKVGMNDRFTFQGYQPHLIDGRPHFQRNDTFQAPHTVLLKKSN